MKKMLSLLLLAGVLLCLCGCSANPLSRNTIETLKSWSFQYNEGTGEYSLFFGLLDNNGTYVAADVDVDVRIEDESRNELYKATREESKKDFGTYTSQIAGEQFLANVRIKKSELAEGTSASGTVYLTVYKENVVSFDEVNCKARACLPVKSITLKAETLPFDIEIKDYSGKTESIIRIEDVAYEATGLSSAYLDVTVSGTKTFGDVGYGYDTFKYKVCDSNGFVVDSGTIFLRNLSAGDKFKDDSITIFDVTPGEEYTIKFSE